MDSTDLQQSLARLRPELHRHCYRMMGTLHEADDCLQDACLRAWQSRASLHEPGALRAWLYAIATRSCLDALRGQRRERGLLLPAPHIGELPAGVEPDAELTWVEPWLEPADAPEHQVEQAQTMRLAFIHALRHLSAQGRAVLLLRDVVGWSVQEVADALGVSCAAVRSALQRARAALAREPLPEVLPASDAMLERYVMCWEAGDFEAFSALLCEDAVFAMPPWRQWFHGRDAIVAFLRTGAVQCGRFRLARVRANGLPALAVQASMDGVHWHRHSVHLPECSARGIARLTAWVDPLGARLLAWLHSGPSTRNTSSGVV